MHVERRRFNFLETVPLLERLGSDVLWDLAYAGEDEQYAPGKVVIREGDPRMGDTHHGPKIGTRDAGRNPMRFYIVRSGSAMVETTDPETGETRPLALLEPGDYFGETGLLTQQARSATVRATSDALEVISFDATTFHSCIAEYVLVFRMVRSQRARELAELSGRAIDVRELGLFNDMPLKELGAVLHDARQESVGAGQDIVTQGERGDRFYVVLEGECCVIKNNEPVAWLSAGDFFGETALLLDCPRTATVRAAGAAEVWSISREAFEVVLWNYLLGHHRHRTTIRTRLGMEPTAA